MTKEREVHLTDGLLSLKIGSNSVNEYLLQFKMPCNILVAIKKLIDELNKNFQLARGLGPEYGDFRIGMLTKPLYSSFTQYVSTLQGHEQLLHDEVEKKQHINHQQAVLSQKKRGRGNARRYNSKGRGVSFYPSYCSQWQYKLAI